MHLSWLLILQWNILSPSKFISITNIHPHIFLLYYPARVKYIFVKKKKFPWIFVTYKVYHGKIDGYKILAIFIILKKILKKDKRTKEKFQQFKNLMKDKIKM